MFQPLTLPSSGW